MAKLIFFRRCCILFSFIFSDWNSQPRVKHFWVRSWKSWRIISHLRIIRIGPTVKKRKRKITMEVAEKKVSAILKGMISSVVENGQVLDREKPSES